jgi:hypothetical protein
MSTVYEDREFQPVYDRDSGAVFSDFEFRRCHFLSSALSITQDPSLRSKIRNVKLVKCSQRGCEMNSAILDDVTVDGFECHGLLQMWGTAFRHVVLRGRIGRLMISSLVDLEDKQPEVQRAFDEANAEFYESVDWALDISQAAFLSFDVTRSRIPAKLVRRDPETQVIVTRKKALSVEWKNLPMNERLWIASLELFIQHDSADVVLAAPKLHPKFSRYLEDLKLLRSAGVAEPD